MIKCNSYKRILDQDSHYIEKLNYELGGWATIKNVLDSKPNLVSSNDIEWVNENINKAVLKYNYGIETVLDDYKKIPKDRPVQFYFDAGYVGWYDESKGENEFEPCPPHIGFNTSYAQMYPDSNRTKNITIVVTEDCPLACSYCYEHSKNKTYMTPARACEIVDFLFKQDLENSKLVNSDVANGLIIEFIGGEPLMAMDTINAFMEHFLSTAIKMRHRWTTRYMISISSNGVLYDTPKVREFIEKYKTRLSLNITIDGNKALHDSCRVFKDGSPSYDIVERSVKKHLAIAPYSSTKLTLSPENVVYTSDAIKNLFTNVGLRVVFANCIFEDGWTPNHAKTLYWQMKDLADWLIDNDFENKYYCSLFSDFIGHPIPPEDNDSYCGGTGAMLSFTADGGIQPCLRYCAFNLNGKRPELRIGTVQDGLLSTDEQKRVFADLKSITRRSQSTDECFYCPIASGCAYCSAHNYEEYGTANKRTTAICPMHKARVLANYYYWNRLYQKRGVDKRVKIDIPDNMAVEIIGADEFAMIKNI